MEESLAERNGLAILGKKHVRTRSNEAQQAVPMIGTGPHNDDREGPEFWQNWPLSKIVTSNQDTPNMDD